ncbi:class I SAM-dependent methyltransferase [Dysgonomonas sp. 216]|uniref:class I SAM-dependent methyltransferase n=1 Tax=Dysgonomonas sp. 216 TaxID=2302934 RepID=UPI0013D8206D|nr:class I SAM-dependent methyltransferase [Dysgonomonas sp. 216]NDW17583.1 class I SAM-dependent methyltransferase [Dysgonomonas sp. 216]
MQNSDYYSFQREELYPFIPLNIKRTLDIGCASGIFSENLKKEKNVETWGIEMVAEVADIARTKLDRVLTGAFDDVNEELPAGYFDCVFFNDVLEHMVYPEDCLKRIKANIAPEGCVIASIPNVRFIEVLIGLLLKKDWKYKNSGVMDKTHLRFFTKKSILRMFDECGYEVKSIKGINSVGAFSLTSIINVLAFNRFEDVKYQQFVVVAYPK